MARLSSMSTRPRSDRARRRVFFCAESLESRQLLSVAAFHPAIAPVANVPAAVGPLVPSSVGTQGTAGSAAGANQGIQVVLEFNPVVSGQSSFNGFTETIFIFEQPSATGTGDIRTDGDRESDTQCRTGHSLDDELDVFVRDVVIAGDHAADRDDPRRSGLR